VKERLQLRYGNLVVMQGIEVACLSPSAILSLAVHGLKLLVVLHFYTAARSPNALETKRVHVAVRANTGVSFEQVKSKRKTSINVEVLERIPRAAYVLPPLQNDIAWIVRAQPLRASDGERTYSIDLHCANVVESSLSGRCTPVCGMRRLYRIYLRRPRKC
jgi:hypothetical protein